MRSPGTLEVYPMRIKTFQELLKSKPIVAKHLRIWDAYESNHPIKPSDRQTPKFPP